MQSNQFFGRQTKEKWVNRKKVESLIEKNPPNFDGKNIDIFIENDDRFCAAMKALVSSHEGRGVDSPRLDDKFLIKRVASLMKKKKSIFW